MNNAIKKKISSAKVACRDVSPAALSTTYFPLQNLTQKTQELSVSRGFQIFAVPGLSDEDSAFED